MMNYKKKLPYITIKYGYVPVTRTVQVIFWCVLLVASNHVLTSYALNNCKVKREGGHESHCTVRTVLIS